MAKHTPGPWHTHSAYWDDICDEGGAIVAQVVAAGDDKISLSNARLLAAAPTMLQTLKSVRVHLSNGNSDSDPALVNDRRLAWSRNLYDQIVEVDAAIKLAEDGE